MKLTRPRAAIGLAVVALVIMCFPTWPLIYGLDALISIRWMGMFTVVYFVWHPLIAFILTLVATGIAAYALPGRPTTRIPSMLYFGAALIALGGRIYGTGWALFPAIVIALLVTCGALALRERPVHRAAQD